LSYKRRSPEPGEFGDHLEIGTAQDAVPRSPSGLQPGSDERAGNNGRCVLDQERGLAGERDPRDEVGLVAAEVRAAFRTLR